MFRFWASDPRGNDKPNAPQPIANLVKPHHSDILQGAVTITSSNVQSLKRSRESLDDSDESPALAAHTKRVKTQCDLGGDADPACDKTAHSTPVSPDLEAARDEIRHQFGLEILLKHNELRLIDQELAKCQIALEQLRRCHLIPYPTNCPTPQQMLDVSAGKGPALKSSPNEPVPKWAPPFGVVDGPYARHYAKWLIPDPSFDGIQPEWQFTSEAVRARASFTEGRTTRNSFDGSALKGRSSRGISGQKLHALSNGYPQPKEKAGPCILKRADGKTVKLVCIDCNRENFSSTQGFINHCRIAHKRDFKSHEEAAVHSGHPIEVNESSSAAEEKTPAIAPTPVSMATSTSASVHPYARPDMTEQQAYIALRSRIQDSLKLYHQGKLPGVTGIPSLPAEKAVTSKSQAQMSGTPSLVPDMPHLSRLLQSRKFDGNLGHLVADVKTKIDMEDITPGEESEVAESPVGTPGVKATTAVRTPVVMRVPAKATQTQTPAGSLGRTGSKKGRAPPISCVTPPNSGIDMGAKRGSRPVLRDEDMDMEDVDLSPNTMVSNNAPSLVSDDGEYDDSDDGSSVSDTSDSLGAESVSDVAEIGLDDEQDPRSLRRDSNGVTGAVRLRKEETKHVTFMSPVKKTTKERRRRRV